MYLRETFKNRIILHKVIDEGLLLVGSINQQNFNYRRITTWNDIQDFFNGYRHHYNRGQIWDVLTDDEAFLEMI